jgi:hypothetical protein
MIFVMHGARPVTRTCKKTEVNGPKAPWKLPAALQSSVLSVIANARGMRGSQGEG